MKKTVIVLSMMLCSAIASAQIPTGVTHVINRCRAAMTNTTGLEYEMDMKAGMGPISMKMHFIVADKGNLNRTSVTTKMLGIEVVSESGFDGTDTWDIKHSTNGDTITFTHGDKRKKSEGNLTLDLDKKYKKAKMKHKDGYYEISFSDPIEKDNEVKNATVKISDKNYVVREICSGARGAKVTMTVTKIRVGLNDSYFKLDLSKYPNAVIIKK
ncbi:MAG: hypothetical protein K5650_06495 [Bacteroidales bacterium]|nr:hypothetical protein [Bacteroidales bacterium]